MCEDKFKIAFLKDREYTQLKRVKGVDYGDVEFTQYDEEKYLFENNDGETGQESKQ